MLSPQFDHNSYLIWKVFEFHSRQLHDTALTVFWAHLINLQKS